MTIFIKTAQFLYKGSETGPSQTSQTFKYDPVYVRSNKQYSMQYTMCLLNTSGNMCSCCGFYYLIRELFSFNIGPEGKFIDYLLHTLPN